MTNERLSMTLKQLDWGQRPLARRLNRPAGTIQQWIAGTVRIPADVAAWLERVARFHEKNPAPQKAQ